MLSNSFILGIKQLMPYMKFLKIPHLMRRKHVWPVLLEALMDSMLKIFLQAIKSHIYTNNLMTLVKSPNKNKKKQKKKKKC